MLESSSYSASPPARHPGHAPSLLRGTSKIKDGHSLPDRQLTFSFHEQVVSASTPRVREAVNELLTTPTSYASRKRVSLVYVASLRDRSQITSPQSAKEFFAKYWQECPGNDQEQFVVACLDTKHRVQSVVVVTIGTLDASLVHPREVFKPAILEGSSSIILSHNHPSGDCTPSREDHTVTERLTEVGKLLGIEVLDHIIYGDGSNEVRSLRESKES